MRRKTISQACGVVAMSLAAVLSTAAFAEAQETGNVVISGLNGPMGVLVTPDGSVWAVDKGLGGDVEMQLLHFETGEPSTWLFGETARIVRATPDGTQTEVARLPSIAFPEDPTFDSGGSGLAMVDGELYVAVGDWWSVGDTERPSGWSVVARIEDGHAVEVANTWDTERERNPDGHELATNPFHMAAGPDGSLWVADAAANDLLKVDPATGKIEVVAVFEGIPGPIPNPERGGAMEIAPVPTGVAFDEEGNVYVALLPGVPFLPGSAKVVRVTPEGAVTDYATGLTMLTDLRRGPDGHLYAVTLAEFTEQGPTPASGEIVRVLEGDASETVLGGLSFPTSIDFSAAGDAYVTLNALGEPGTGEVVRYEGLAAPSGPGH